MPDIFKQKAIDSRSNCIACHTAAFNGVYAADNTEKGREIFNQICAPCHGIEGEGLLAPPFTTGTRFKTKKEALTFVNIIIPAIAPGACEEQCPKDSVKYIMETIHKNL